MNVKAQGLLNAAKWVEAEYGRDALGDVIRACGPAVRDRYTSAIAIEWHPVDELVEFLTVAEKMLGKRDGSIAERIGAAGARANLSGALVRTAMYFTRPEFLMKRIAGLWSQFNDEGEMLLIAFDDKHAAIEVKGVRRPQELFCATLTGWCHECSVSLGITDAQARHTKCRARGDSRCLWEIRGTAADGMVITPFG